MIKIKYFFEFIIITFLFSAFKILGIKLSTRISEKLFLLLGPFFRSKKTFDKNIKKAFPNINNLKKKRYTKICGVTMEEYFLNICLLNILDIQKSFPKT